MLHFGITVFSQISFPNYPLTIITIILHFNYIIVLEGPVET